MKVSLFSALTVALGLILMPIPSVSAAAELEGCTPALDSVLTEAPKQVSCTFTEPLVIGQSTLAVFDANNNQVDNKDIKLDPADAEGQTLIVSLNGNLTNGTYKIQWVTVSKEDNGRAEGQVAFSINAGTVAPTNPSSASSTTPTQPGTSTAPSTPAQAPALIAAPTFRDDPGAAAIFGATVQSMPAHAVQWFRFNYDTAGYQSPRPTVTVRLLNGVSNGLGFEIWSPEGLQGGWWQNKPVGRGTRQVLPSCAEPDEEGGDESEGGGSGEEGGPSEEGGSAEDESVEEGQFVKGVRVDNEEDAIEENGKPDTDGPNDDEDGLPDRVRVSQTVTAKPGATSTSDGSAGLDCGKWATNDLTWTGGFGGNGTYYVRLVNPTNAPIIPQLLISGAGLVECANANLGLPAWGKVPGPDEAFVQVQCLDVGPGLVYTDEEPAASGEDEEGGDE